MTSSDTSHTDTRRTNAAAAPPPGGPGLTRRGAIAAGLVAGAALVTACGSGDSGSSGGGSDDELLPTSGAALGTVADVPAGGSLVVTVGAAPVALAKKSDGTVVAHTGVCTHQKCAVQADGAELKCPCHQSRFDAVSGAVLKGPATAPLAEITIKADGDAITVA